MPKKSKTIEGSSGTVTTSSVDAKAARASTRSKKVVVRLGFGEGVKPTAKRRVKSLTSKSKAIKKAASPKKSKAGTKKKAKKEKDPNKPKRPMSAFFFYSQENRERIKKENPSASFSEVGKLLGSEWNKVTDAQKRNIIYKLKRLRKIMKKKLVNIKRRKLLLPLLKRNKHSLSLFFGVDG